MQRATKRMTTVHMLEAHKPPRERCSGFVPKCSMNHYVSVPTITIRGSWPVSHMVSDAEMAGLAILYRNLGGERW